MARGFDLGLLGDVRRLTAGGSDASRTTVSHRDDAVVIDHGDLAGAFGEPQHFIHVLRLGLYVDVVMLRIGLPGLLGVGSP